MNRTIPEPEVDTPRIGQPLVCGVVIEGELPIVGLDVKSIRGTGIDPQGSVDTPLHGGIIPCTQADKCVMRPLSS